MFPFWFALLGGSFVFLDMGPSILFLVFFFFWGALVDTSMHQTFSTISEIVRHSSFCLENPHSHNTMLA